MCWGEKWVRREISKQKNPRRGCRKRKASEKTHSGSLSIGCGEKSGRGEKQASGKAHCVGVGREKQEKKPPRKLIGRLRGENWARREAGKRKSPRRGRRRRNASKKTHMWIQEASKKINNQYLKYWLLFESNDIVWSAI